MPRLNLDDLIHREPRRAARWVQEHLSDVPRLAERGGHDAVEWVQARLPSRRELKDRGQAASDRAEHTGRDAVEWVQARLPSRRDLRDLQRRAPDAGALLWPTVIAAAGAGAAFWWWTSWSRGRAEAEQAAAEGAAHPDEIMAHAPHASTPPPSHDPANGLAEPVEDVMAHAPPPAPTGKLKTVKPVVAPKAEAALRRNLAVQAEGEGPPAPPKLPKPPRAPKADA